MPGSHSHFPTFSFIFRPFFTSYSSALATYTSSLLGSSDNSKSMFQNIIIKMSSHSFYCLSTLLLCFHSIFHPHALVAADETQGQLQFYDDYNCNTPSTLNPTVTLPLSTCLVHTGAEGVVIDTVPKCPQGGATPIYYSDTACGVQTNNVSPSIFSKSCFQLAEGVGIYNAKSLMFTCASAASNPHASSTTTAVVSGLAAVATGSSGSNGSGSGSGSSTSSAGGSSSTGTNSQNNGTGSTGGSSGSSTGTGSKSSSGLSTSDIIALAVGLGVGIFTIVMMIIIWKNPKVKDMVLKVIPIGSPQQSSPSSQSAPGSHSAPEELAIRPNKMQQRHYDHWYELPSPYTGPQQSQYNRPQEMDAQQRSFRHY